MPSYKRLLIASSKGGVGKSTTALGLAVSFAREGKNVLLVDLDSTSRSLDMLIGSENSALFDFGDIISGKEPDDVIIKSVCDIPTLSFVPACHKKRLNEICSESEESEESAVRRGTSALLGLEGYDYFIFDTGGGISFPSAVADLFDLILITSEQSKTSVRASEYAAAYLEKNSSAAIRLVICSFDLSSVRRENRAGIIEMIDSSFLSCVGVVPFDKKLQRAQDNGHLPDKNAVSSTAYRNIARRIEGYDTHLFSGMGKLEKKRMKAL